MPMLSDIRGALHWIGEHTDHYHLSVKEGVVACPAAYRGRDVAVEECKRCSSYRGMRENGTGGKVLCAPPAIATPGGVPPFV